MEIKSGQELYDAGAAQRERDGEPDLTISPLYAEAVGLARAQAGPGARGDSIGKALEQAEHSGRIDSFLEFYKGPLSKSVLASLFEAGLHESDIAQPETA
jgi:hypothetical protein